MIAHDFSGQSTRCIYCGTTEAHYVRDPAKSPCLTRHNEEALRPEPSRREYVIDAFDTIRTRVHELHAERTAALNEPAKDDAT